MDDDGKLAPVLPVEDRNQPLVGIPLNGAFGGDPFRAALPAGAGRAVRDVEDHGVGRRADTADRRPLCRLRQRKTGGDKTHQGTEDGSTPVNALMPGSSRGADPPEIFYPGAAPGKPAGNFSAFN